MNSDYAPLIVWSGGVDSTYVLNWYLQYGISVHVCYIILNNNKDKVKKELKARKNIRKLLDKKYPNKILSDRIFDRIFDRINIPVDVIKGWRGFDVQCSVWSWATALCSKNISEIVFGYVLGDSFWKYKKKFIKAYKSNYRLFWISKDIPNINFPLSDHYKVDVYKKSMNEEWYKLCWVCERPTNNKKSPECGECNACITRSKTLLEIR